LNDTALPLRIAHVANEPFGLNVANGVQHVVYCLAQAQADLGAAVAVFTRDDRGMHVFGPESAARPHHATRTPAGFGALMRRRLLARYFEPALAENLFAWSPNFVHFHSVHGPQNVVLAAHLAGVAMPYCVTPHGALFPAALQRNKLKKVVFSGLFERHYLNAADFIHALGPSEADAIRRHSIRCPIVIAPNGLPPESRLSPSDPDALFRLDPSLGGRLILMFVGRLDPWQKGLDLLLRGFAQAGSSDAALVLVGPDHRGSRAALETLADELGVRSRVSFLEAAFGQDRANLLAAADVFVHPSRWEGLSLSVLAAAAAGKACLLTREADPFGEFERAESAFIVEAATTSIAEGLRRAVGVGREHLQLMGGRARHIAGSRFSWRAAAEETLRAYRQSLDRMVE
jgi:glycosyltransferase involved in cell wall biosynthesis